MELSEEQQTAFSLYRRGGNLFLTGPGGTGKSALIRHIYEDATNRGLSIHVCALTGCAAVLLQCNASSLHSWAGIGLGKGTIEELVKKVRGNIFAIRKWRQTRILVVDEVSMLSMPMFDALNQIGQAVRRSNRPFGGIQLLFSGDFYQLPPIQDTGDNGSERFCFESPDWFSVFPRESHIVLKKVFRQKDEVFSRILNQIREGRIKRSSYELLLGYVGRDKPAGVAVTQLYPTRAKAMQLNATMMHKLESDGRAFERKSVIQPLDALTRGERERRQHFTEKEVRMELAILSSGVLCEPELLLKIGAQVMCVVNIKEDETDSSSKELVLCNGSQGIVVGFSEPIGYPIVRFNSGLERVMEPHLWASERIPGVGVSQIPLLLAWALTIHKSQGATLDAAEIDVGSGIFACGQTYVALSRVKSLDGLFLRSFDVEQIRIDPRVKAFYSDLQIPNLQIPNVEITSATPS